MTEVAQHDETVANLADARVHSGSEDLVYLAISTAVLPEVVGDPDSGRTGVRVPSDQSPASRFLLQDSAKNTVAYWDGEEGDVVGRIIGKERSGNRSRRGKSDQI
jgi:hypothetical protein